MHFPETHPPTPEDANHSFDSDYEFPHKSEEKDIYLHQMQRKLYSDKYFLLNFPLQEKKMKAVEIYILCDSPGTVFIKVK